MIQILWMVSVRYLNTMVIVGLLTITFARAQTVTVFIDNTDAYAAEFELAEAGDGVLTLRCTAGTSATYAARNEPKIVFYQLSEGFGLFELTYLESRGVTWQLNRRKLIPVSGCAFGEAAAFVQQEQYITSNPVDEPDVKRMLRSMAVDPASDAPVTFETKSMKTFLAPDGGKPYARYQKIWDAETWALDKETLTLKRQRGKFDEISARTDLSRDNVSARTGYVRMDTPLQRSEVPN